jgi:hydroxymethylpyrimidine/phosphomethylpyrimidine kinase
VIPNLLSIAGFDPSGGAGVAADLKTFAALGCNGMAVVTALTAQNTRGVTAMHVPPADFAAAQIDAIFGDIEVAAVKMGMLACGAIAEEVGGGSRRHAPRRHALHARGAKAVLIKGGM